MKLINRVELLHQLVEEQAELIPETIALKLRDNQWSYKALSDYQTAFASGVSQRSRSGNRIAIWLSKSAEFVVSAFGATKAGCIFVPINPVLKSSQVGHIINDCDAEILVTSFERVASLEAVLENSGSIKHVMLVGDGTLPKYEGINVVRWAEVLSSLAFDEPNIGVNESAAIFYTSGSTGMPKGVVVPHRSLVSGADSVAQYLQMNGSDRILAAMPLSFDAGFSQLTTSFSVGASCYLLEYFLASEVVGTIQRECITGLTGVPPFWSQLANANWKADASKTLRFFASTGGRMPEDTLKKLRKHAPKALPYLMYGLTEAFRSTYLDPSEIDQRTNSIGKAIPGQKVYVARPDGSPCEPDEVGELVHVGSTVCLGYWGNAEATNERYKLVQHSCAGVMLQEMAVFSGDQARSDSDGFLYFVGRIDEMIKSQGYRISPVEIEETLRTEGLIDDVLVYGISDKDAGQKVAIVAYAGNYAGCLKTYIIDTCREKLPNYMIPESICILDSPLPRNPNGKLDRTLIIKDLNTAEVRGQVA